MEFAIFGTASASFQAVRYMIEKINHVRLAYKGNKDVQSHYCRLHKRYTELEIVFKGIMEHLETRETDSSDSSTKHLKLLRNRVVEDIEKVVSELNRIMQSVPKSGNNLNLGEDEMSKFLDSERGTSEHKNAEHCRLQGLSDEVGGSSSTGVRRCLKKVKYDRSRMSDAFKTGFKISSLVESMKKADSLLENAVNHTSNMAILINQRDMFTEIRIVRDQNPRESEAFTPHFDFHPTNSNIVLDFESRDSKGEPTTPEGRLLSLSLNLGRCKGAAALGTHGMGGIGKTTALKGICNHESVSNVFKDGTCFLEFGQNASDRTVMEQLTRCVFVFGGKTKAGDMKKLTCLDDIVRSAAEWLNKRSVLLVCDDLWPLPDRELGYLVELKKVLRNAPGSGLLVSTRDRNIANAFGAPVHFEVLETYGTKAREIIGTVAFGSNFANVTSNWECETEFRKILEVCAGLPLALAIAGKGINSHYADGNTKFALRKYAKHFGERELLDQCRSIPAYQLGLKHVVEASLNECETWGRTSGRNYDMRSMFKALCVLEKQMRIPESVLMLLWQLERAEVQTVLQKFVDCSLVRREIYRRSAMKNDDAEEEYGLRVHDLVLMRCQDMAKNEKAGWHGKLVKAYSCILKRASEAGGKQIDWWESRDDGYVFANLTRHMAGSGDWDELEKTLCDVRWTMLRMDAGGWLSLSIDFERLLVKHVEKEVSEIRRLLWVLERSWHCVHHRRRLFPFYVFGHLSRRERESEYIGRYLASVIEHFPRPWLLPLNECISPRDSREQYSWPILGRCKDFCVSWSTRKLFIAWYDRIQVWSLQHQAAVLSIKANVTCIAVSGDGSVIVSGSEDGTVQRWNGKTGEAVGEPMSGHASFVARVAVSGDGSVIVSGSYDGTVRRWNAKTGEAVGKPMCGNTSGVLGVAFNGDASVIVSISDDRTVQRWNGMTGEAVGKSMCGHMYDDVSSVAVSGDGSVIASGCYDGTVRRWNAKTGVAIGEPMCRHTAVVTGVAVSGDGSVIVSGSEDKTVQMWNAKTGVAVGKPMCGHTGALTGVAVSGDGSFIVSRSLDGTVRLWKAKTGESVSEPISRHTDVVTSVAVSEDGSVIVSGSKDSTVRRWNAKIGEAVGEPMCGHTDVVTSVAVSGDGSVIVSGSKDNTARRWNARTRELISEETVRNSTDLRAIANGRKEKMNWDSGARAMLPYEASTAVVMSRNNAVFGLENRCVAVCEHIVEV